MSALPDQERGHSLVQVLSCYGLSWLIKAKQNVSHVVFWAGVVSPKDDGGGDNDDDEVRAKTAYYTFTRVLAMAR